MSDTNNEYEFMSETEIAALSVRALSNRPNEHSGQYGKGGLTPEGLKAAFSALPEAVARRLNGELPRMLRRIGDTEESVSELDGRLAGKMDKLKPPVGAPEIHSVHLYSENSAGQTVFVKGHITPEPSTIVYRTTEGDLHVKDPTAKSHPVNKKYFDLKSNNSLYRECADMEHRIKNLEHSANGTVYETKTIKGLSDVLQVDNACPYGIISKLGGNVAKVTVGLPFDTSGTLCHTSGVTVSEYTANSVAMPIGEKYNIKIPCSIAATCTVTVYISERGTSYLNKCGLMDSGKNQIGGQVTFRDGVSELTLEYGSVGAEYLCITKVTQGTALSEPCYLDDIRVMLTEPWNGKIMRVVDEIEIPEAIRSLEGYGEEGAYIDVQAKTFVASDGSVTDVSALLPDEFDVISLLPSAIIAFTDGNGGRAMTDYEISYKNKI